MPTIVLFPSIRVKGTPLPVTREVSVMTRPGVADFGENIGALRGAEYKLKTFIDCVDVAAADIAL